MDVNLSTKNGGGRAPDIIGAIPKGTHPQMLTLSMLRRGIPDKRNDQRELYGFETSAKA